jgi:hypothetical protein
MSTDDNIADNVVDFLKVKEARDKGTGDEIIMISLSEEQEALDDAAFEEMIKDLSDEEVQQMLEESIEELLTEISLELDFDNPIEYELEPNSDE